MYKSSNTLSEDKETFMEEVYCVVNIFSVEDGRKVKVTFDEPADINVLNDISEYFRCQLDSLQLGTYEVCYNCNTSDIKIQRYISKAL